jgi:glycine C-acetyltransferase
MRSQIFAKSLPMPLVIGALKRLELLKTKPELKDRLWEIATKLQNSLKENGFNIGSTSSPVTPVILKCDENQVAKLAIDLRENYSLFCSPVCYPVIPKGLIILRLIPTALHTEEDIEKTVKALIEIYEKLKNNEYISSEYEVA